MLEANLGAQWPYWLNPAAQAQRVSFDVTETAFRAQIPGVAPGYWDYLDVSGMVPPQAYSPYVPGTVTITSPQGETRQIIPGQKAPMPGEGTPVSVKTASKWELLVSRGGSVAIAALVGFAAYKLVRS